MENSGKYHVRKQRREILQRVACLVCARQGDDSFGSLPAHSLRRRLSGQAGGEAVYKAGRSRDKRPEQAQQAEIIPYSVDQSDAVSVFEIIWSW